MKERRLGKQPDVLNIVPFGSTSLNKLVKEGNFPAPIVFAGGRTKYWDMDEVQEWIQAHLDARPINQPKHSAPEVFKVWYERPAKDKQSADRMSPILKSEPASTQTPGKHIHLIGQ